jgi:arginyl-tRNA synthetase
MNLLADLRDRVAAAVGALGVDPAPYRELVRRSQDPRHGDYQADCAMPLARVLRRPPREVAAELVARLDVGECFHAPQIAGPGFINFRLRDDWLAGYTATLARDARLGVASAALPRTYVVDYSSPNVAKPMHVGHIRTTVIGDCLCRVLRFLGHRVIGDNHLGDWGTQFGMIIYGYKHFADRESLQRDLVAELARLYRLVNELVEYHEAVAALPQAEGRREALAEELARAERVAARASGDPQSAQRAAKDVQRCRRRLQDAQQEVESLRARIAAIERDPQRAAYARQHADIGRRVLEETARLHAGDAENRRLWEQFMPACLAQLEAIYRRLGVTFDVTLGESFYQDRLAGVVDDLLRRGIARETQGAVAVFLDGFDTPMLVRKSDGAFLYATTDLATIQYRCQTWNPHAILYVVDHRQSLHFEQLFATARAWGYTDVELRHIAFGTILDESGRPFKTRSGGTVGLEELLDEAVAHALRVVSQADDAKPQPELSAQERQRVAEIVGLGALKYADLSHNRTSDYVFSYEKMLSLTGNTATYLQYAYARVQGILRRAEVDAAALRDASHVVLPTPEERHLALALARLPEVLDEVLVDYRPNLLTGYLYDDVAQSFTAFYEACPVLKADEPQRLSRLLLCDLTGRVIRQGLALLGIDVAQRL